MRKKQINWNTYPETPEGFRKYVRQAVQEQLAYEPADRELRKEAQGKTDEKRYGGKSSRKRYRYRGWLAAAALVTFGSITVLAGRKELKSFLVEQGFLETDAEVLAETEPEQQSSELTDFVLPKGRLMEKAWGDPLLTIREACFDGTTLYFMADASEEGKAYELYLRDHASMNDYDSLTGGLMQTEEGAYFGTIELLEKEYAQKILESGSVQVRMKVIAQPKYEGEILYTWKDEAAYEELFGKGAFLDADGRQYYVLSREDALAGYTPQMISMEIPLDQASKETLAEYQEMARNMEAADPVSAGERKKDGELGSSQDPQEANGTAVSAETEAERMGTKAAGGESVQKYAGTQITDHHVKCQMPGADGTLQIDAEVIQEAQEVYMGTFEPSILPAEQLARIYGETDAKDWEQEKDARDNESWQHKTERVFVSSDKNMGHLSGGSHYQNSEIDEFGVPQQWTEADAQMQDQQAEALCVKTLETLGISADTVELEPYAFGEGIRLSDARYDYFLNFRLEDLIIAEGSQWNGRGSMILWDNQVLDVNMPGMLNVVSREKAELLDMEAILEHAADYVRTGEISGVGQVPAVTEIRLKYFTDLTMQGLVFRPVWSFQIPYTVDEWQLGLRRGWDYFYLDAVTGALVWDVWCM